ncbi:MAG: hypothetical protein AB2693_23405 [Candidatus Thiodiazotropha sp.]
MKLLAEQDSTSLRIKQTKEYPKLFSKANTIRKAKPYTVSNSKNGLEFENPGSSMASIKNVCIQISNENGSDTDVDISIYDPLLCLQTGKGTSIL